MALKLAAERRLFTRAEYHRMGEVGILGEDDRVELIKGEIVKMSPIGRHHVAFVNNLNQLLVTRLTGRAIVSVQNPVVLSDDTEPEPDLTVLRQRSYKHAEPAVADVLLLMEVAETSLRYDRVTKRPLYAEAGVPEYWIVDCGAESIDLHRGPAHGGYRDVTRVTGAAESVSLLAFPDVVLGLAEIFA
jgi:Uma2 family endonuclease